MTYLVRGLRAGHVSMRELWDDERANFAVAATCRGGEWFLVEISPMAFTDALVLTPMASDRRPMLVYIDRWCYGAGQPAFDAAWNWLAEGAQGEPAGWHRHPETGRRRPDGDPIREYVNF